MFLRGCRVESVTSTCDELRRWRRGIWTRAAGPGPHCGLRSCRSPVNYEMMELCLFVGAAWAASPNATSSDTVAARDRSTWEILRTRAPGPLTSSPARKRRRRPGAPSRPPACQGNRARLAATTAPRRARGPRGAPYARPRGTRGRAPRAGARSRRATTPRACVQINRRVDGVEVGAMLRHGFAPALRLDPGLPRCVVKCQARHGPDRRERQPRGVGVGAARRPRRLAVVAGFRRVAAEAQRCG